MKIQIPRYKGFKVGIFQISPIDDYEENRFFNFEFLNKVVNFIHMFQHEVRPSFFYFLFYRFFSQVSVRGRNKNKNKIHSDHFPIELKSKEHNCVSFDFNSIGKWSE